MEHGAGLALAGVAGLAAVGGAQSTDLRLAQNHRGLHLIAHGKLPQPNQAARRNFAPLLPNHTGQDQRAILCGRYDSGPESRPSHMGSCEDAGKEQMRIELQRLLIQTDQVPFCQQCRLVEDQGEPLVTTWRRWCGWRHWSS